MLQKGIRPSFAIPPEKVTASLAWPARLGSLGVETFIDAARAAGPLLTTALAGLMLTLAAAAVLLAWFCRFEDGRADA